MTRDDIIRMAREAGFADGVAEIVGLEGFARFAALVLAKHPPQSSMAWQEGFEAGRLADALEEKEYPPRRAAAAELRRLHEENERLKAASTAPRQWVGLTEEEIELLSIKHAPPIHPDFTEDDDFIEFARAIEAKLKEKNT
jgi:hypothetical protein